MLDLRLTSKKTRKKIVIWIEKKISILVNIPKSRLDGALEQKITDNVLGVKIEHFVLHVAIQFLHQSTHQARRTMLLP